MVAPQIVGSLVQLAVGCVLEHPQVEEAVVLAPPVSLAVAVMCRGRCSALKVAGLQMALQLAIGIGKVAATVPLLVTKVTLCEDTWSVDDQPDHTGSTASVVLLMLIWYSV